MTDLALVLLTTPGINYGGSLNSQDEFDAWLGETLAVYTQGLQGSGPVQVPDVAEMAQSLLDQIGGCTGVSGLQNLMFYLPCRVDPLLVFSLC